MAHLLEPFAGRRAHLAAEQLIARFGGLSRALSATPAQLAEALGGDRRLAGKIVAARALVAAALHEQVARAPVSVHDPAFRDYLRLRIGGAASERLHVTFVAPDRGYIADDVLAQGSLAHVQLDLRHLLARAFETGAHGVILAHNHPSGSAEPSAHDIALTLRIVDLAGAVGVHLLDHLIIGAGDIVSMRERELI